MLEAQFAGLGEPIYTELLLSESAEYLIVDRKYGLSMHTFVNASEATPVELLKRHAQRIRWLRDRMNESLSDSVKILVYKECWRLTEEEIARIVAGFGAYGVQTLLWVRQADANNLPGTVAEAGAGLIFGYLDRLNPILRSSKWVWDIPFDQWLSICGAAASLCDKYNSRHVVATTT